MVALVPSAAEACPCMADGRLADARYPMFSNNHPMHDMYLEYIFAFYKCIRKKQTWSGKRGDADGMYGTVVDACTGFVCVHPLVGAMHIYVQGWGIHWHGGGTCRPHGDCGGHHSHAEASLM